MKMAFSFLLFKGFNLCCFFLLSERRMDDHFFAPDTLTACYCV